MLSHNTRGARAVVFAAIVAGGVSGRPAVAHAETFSQFGAGPKGVALAGGGGAIAEDSWAVFSCPAGMAFGDPSVSLSVLGLLNRMGINLSPRPAGYDPPDLGSGSPVIPYKYRLTPRQSPGNAPGYSAFTVGGTISLGVDWLRIGLLAFIPMTGVGREYTYFPDEREQYFSNTLRYEIYGEKLATEDIMAAISIRPLSWFAVSGGARIAITSQTNTLVYMPSVADQANIQPDLRVSTGFKVAPTASAAFRLLDDHLRLYATFRDELISNMGGTNTIQVNGFQGTKNFPIVQTMDFAPQDIPRQVAWGGAIKFKPATIMLDFTWTQWSAYRNDVDELAGWSDTINGSVGAEINVAEKSKVRGGFGIRPTPVPPQTGRTNYVDNTMWIVGLGFGQTVNLGKQSLDVEAFGQLQLAAPQTVVKSTMAKYPNCVAGVKTICDEVPDSTLTPGTNTPAPAAQGLQTGNPGFPGYSSGGWVGMAGVAITWRYQ